MPIKREDYPENWPEIRRKILLRAGGSDDDPRIGSCCEWCKLRNYSVVRRWDDGYGETISEHDNYSEARDETKRVWRRPDWRWKPPIVIVLTIAHINDRDPMNVDDDNLAALCQQCHNRHDMQQRVRTRRKRKLIKWANQVGQAMIPQTFDES